MLFATRAFRALQAEVQHHKATLRQWSEAQARVRDRSAAAMIEGARLREKADKAARAHAKGLSKVCSPAGQKRTLEIRNMSYHLDVVLLT